MFDALIGLDRALFCAFNAIHAPWADPIFWLLTQFGQGWLSGGLLLAGIMLRIPKDRRWRIIGICLTAMLAGSLTAQGLKRVIGRYRPVRYFDDPVAAIAGFQVHVVGPVLRYNSFPSGHAIAAFCAGTLAVIFLGNRFWPAFLVAAAVAYSRIYVGAHFPLDVIISAVLGTGIALAIGLPLKATDRGGGNG
ncbi:MAG: phosphatase PAP2 family protein [Candidatus Geothermincolia bacterium]